MATSLPRDDLEAIAAAAWARLERAVADPRAAFRRMQVASLGAQGWPEVRSVILRRADAGQRRLVFHTDARSAKAAEIAADGRVALHLWDGRARLQLRLWGQASVETATPLAEAEWHRLDPQQRALHLGPLPSGRPIEAPELADPSPVPADDATRGAFAAVEVRIARFEWLHLAATGHRRARFDWQGGWQGRWLVP